MRNRLRAAVFIVTVVLLLAGSLGYAAASSADDDLFSEEQKELIEKTGTLKVGYVADRVPISFTNAETGELDGVSRRIFDRIAAISGLKFDYVELPGGSVTYDYLIGEGFDLVTSVEYNEENKKARGILISHPYLSTRKVIVARSDIDFSQKEKLQVAIATGSQTLKKVLTEHYPSFEIVDYDTIEDCFEAVADGKADILIQNQYVAEYRLLRAKYSDLQVIPVMELADELCFSAVGPVDTESEEWKEKSAIVDIIDTAIGQISIDEVTNYIITETSEHKYNYNIGDFMYAYRYSILAFAIGAVIVVVLIIVSFGLYVKTVKAQSESKAKGQFLSTMSHEIRTPLNGLIGLNNLMERNLDDREKMRTYVKQSSLTAQYLLSLVNDVLDMSRIQDQNMEMEREPFSVAAVLEAVSTMEKSRMEEKGLHFTLDADTPFDYLVGDGAHMEQILMNLIDNAYKFTKSGGKVTVRVRQERQEEEMVLTRIEVSDTGCGMSEAFQKKIFDSFTQERDTVSKGNQGTGLGMAISSGLAKLMGGSLRVESEPGKGSCFTFEFPAQIARETDEKTEKPRTEDRADPDKKARILVAEDNELNGQILSELLQESGFETELVSNGQEALERFHASEPGYFAFILMDMMMPVKDGMATTKEIRALERPDAKTVKIFACTANAFKEDEEKALACGMNGFVAKPVDINRLLRMLREE